jgi:hypothetical protein
MKKILLFPCFAIVISLLSWTFADTILYKISFENIAEGLYDESLLNKDFNHPTWNDGVKEGRVHVVKDAKENKCLQVTYPAHRFGTQDGGAQWILRLDKNYEELYCSYRLKFGKDFDFVRGGKLPGLAGGKGNTGGKVPDGTDGWSARMMWKKQGKIIQYVYHPGQVGTYGDAYEWKDASGNVLYFEPGHWYTVEHHILMNTPGKNNGLIEAWLDGEKVLEIPRLRFRDVNTFAIDKFLFSTFFGGSDSTWATSKDEFVFFDDFIISTSAVKH